jgi:hypothetical protein
MPKENVVVRCERKVQRVHQKHLTLKEQKNSEVVMTKLCPRGKAAAKRKFKVYPSAYANAYASKICAGKIKDPSGVKRKDFKGPKPAGKAMGGRISRAGGGVAEAARKLRAQGLMGGGMAMPRAMYGKGGGVCKRGMGRAYGKNS